MTETTDSARDDYQRAAIVLLTKQSLKGLDMVLIEARSKKSYALSATRLNALSYVFEFELKNADVTAKDRRNG